jgi:CheY-like chemotaxis protein
MEKIKVLLADNSTFTRIILSNTLETLGFAVVAVAKDGKEALEKFTEHVPDIALVDLQLNGVDGISVIRALTERYPATPIVMMIPENIDEPDIIVQAIRAGAKAYINKPTSGEEVKKRLEKLLKRGGEI